MPPERRSPVDLHLEPARPYRQSRRAAILAARFDGIGPFGLFNSARTNDDAPHARRVVDGAARAQRKATRWSPEASRTGACPGADGAAGGAALAASAGSAAGTVGGTGISGALKATRWPAATWRR